MKTLSSLLAAWLLWVGAAAAQVTVETTLAQDQFLPGEPILVAVKISNLSGQTLTFGQDAEWLSFTLETREGALVQRQGEVPVLGEFKVETTQAGTRRVDLAPYFSVHKFGRYKVTATVKIPAWDKQVSSRPTSFDVVNGTKLWEQEFGLPAEPGQAQGAPEVRKYALLQANLVKHLRLYVRITDAAEEHIYRLFSLGDMVSINRPEAQLDKYGNLHVLYQVGAHSFNYSVVNPQGRLMLREAHDYTTSRPRLSADQDGRISIRGGARRETANDLPPSAPPVSTNRPVAAP
jgi:hypothetical protein